jgi:hypothetical protein
VANATRYFKASPPGPRGVALLDVILSDEDAGYDPAGYPDEELAVLGRLDDDFQL